MTAIAGCAAFVVALVAGWPAVLLVGTAALVAALCGRGRSPLLVVMVVCAVAGDLRGSAVLDEPRATVGGGPHQGVLTSYARRTEGRQRFVVETADGVVLCVGTDRRLSLGRGDVVRFGGEVVAWGDLEPSRGAALRQIGCSGTVDASGLRVVGEGGGLRRRLDGTRRSIAEWFEATVPGDPGALLSGLVIGDDDGLSFGTREHFYRLGMSHITAVSGSNLALLTWLLIGRGGARRPLVVDVGTLALLWLYVLLAGAGPSTVRAGLTATLCVVVARTGRRPDLLTIACLVAAAQVAIDPGLIGNLAYRLSTIAMLVMISTLTGRPGTGLVGQVRQLVACSIAIQLATLPFTPSTDQSIVAGMVANILAAPLVGLAFSVAMAAALMRPLYEPAAGALATVAEMPASLIIDLVVALDRSTLGRLGLAEMTWLPEQLVRLGLVGLVVLSLGRHARRGLGDAWGRVAGTSETERGVWLGVVGGAALGAVLLLASR